MSMNVSIIICTADKPESLAATLDSLSKLELPVGMDVELIVVDNRPETARSTVDAADLKNMSVHYVQEAKRGLSNARNTGIANSTGEILIFTDDDLRFPANWVQALIEPITTNSADAVAGTVRMADHLRRDWMTTYHRICFAEMLEPLGGSFELVGANMAFHRRVLNRVPEFDVELGAGALGFCEESFFSVRLRDAGYRVVMNTNAELTHHFDPSRLLRSSMLKHSEQLGRSCAFVDYHWGHSNLSAPYLRRLRKSIQIGLRRLRRGKPSPMEEGCEEEALFEVKGWGFADQYIKESSRPHKYQRPDSKSNGRVGLGTVVTDILTRKSSS